MKKIMGIVTLISSIISIIFLIVNSRLDIDSSAALRHVTYQGFHILGIIAIVSFVLFIFMLLRKK